MKDPLLQSAASVSCGQYFGRLFAMWHSRPRLCPLLHRAVTVSAREDTSPPAVARRARANPLLRFTFIVGLVFVLCASALAADQAQLTVLPNGLRVVTQEMHSAPVVSTYVYYHVGSRNECTGSTGISHFIEHMLFKGTRQFRPGEVSRLVTSTGGWDNGFTWLDFTAYVETLPAAYLDLALRIEADRMPHALFAPDDVKSEKTVVLSELEGDENDPGFYLSNAVEAAAFMAHPYHSPTIGWKSDVTALTRDKALSYYHSFYAPDNATLVIVGDFETSKALARVRDLFGPIPPRPSFPKVVTVEPPQEGERRVMVRRPGATGMVEMVFHAVKANHPDHYALDVVETVLGTGRTSRLYQALVDKKLAAEAEAYNYTNLDPGLFEVHITLAEGVDHRTAEQAALAEIDKLSSDLITERELQRAKNQAKASFVYSTDSVSSLGYMLGFFDVVANYRLMYEYADRIDRVTREQVREVVRRYLRADNRTVGWFIPTGAAPAGPAARPGPVSRGAFRSRSAGVLAREASDGCVHLELVSSMWEPRPAAIRIAQRIRSACSGQAGLPRVRWPIPTVPEHTPANMRVAGQGAGQAAGTSQAAAPVRKPIRFQLPNGATFIVYENPVAPAVSVRGMVGAGSIFNPTDKPGLANFVAEMLSRGAAGRSWRDIAESLEFVAADVDVGGGIQVGNISGRCLKTDLPLVIQTLADEVRRPDFPPDQVELVRSQLQVALREAAQDTGDVAERELYATLYPAGHPLHYRPLGTLEGVAAITRDDLVAFHSHYYRPDTLILAVAGDVTEAAVRELAQKCFGDWQASGERPAIVIPDVQPPAQAVRKMIPLAGKTQSDIAIGLPGVSRLSPDYYAAELLNYVLGGGGFSSRLMTRIRDEQGLAYYVYSYFAAYRGAGPWMLRMGVNPARVDQAITSAFAELGRINTQPPGERELQLWKDYVTGTLALSLETNAGIAASLSDAEFYGLGLDYPWRYPEIIRKLTPGEVAAAGRKYITPDHAVTIIAGPAPAGQQ